MPLSSAAATSPVTPVTPAAPAVGARLTALPSLAQRGLPPDPAGLPRLPHPGDPKRPQGLPAPQPLVTNLARCVVEILAGAREIEQIARWVTDDVYRHLLKRVVLATRARNSRGTPVARPTFTVGSVRLTEPDAGVVEAVVVMHGRVRSRAVAVRLESMGTRWRATAIHVL